MSSASDRAGITIRPTAWFWWAAGLTSLIATVFIAVCGALASFVGGDLRLGTGPWSVIFWVVLLATIACFCVSIVLLPITRRREVRAGYTTVPTMVRQIEWRDHATGLVLRKAGEPTPTGSIVDLRRLAHEHREGIR